VGPKKKRRERWREEVAAAMPWRGEVAAGTPWQGEVATGTQRDAGDVELHHGQPARKRSRGVALLGG
jgi:hypothetical protein